MAWMSGICRLAVAGSIAYYLVRELTCQSTMKGIAPAGNKCSEGTWQSGPNGKRWASEGKEMRLIKVLFAAAPKSAQKVEMLLDEGKIIELPLSLPHWRENIRRKSEKRRDQANLNGRRYLQDGRHKADVSDQEREQGPEIWFCFCNMTKKKKKKNQDLFFEDGVWSLNLML